MLELAVFALGYRQRGGRNGVIESRYLGQAAFARPRNKEDDYERIHLGKVLHHKGTSLSIRLWSNISHDRRNTGGLSATQLGIPRSRPFTLVGRQREGKGSAAFPVVRSLHGSSMGFDDRPTD